MTVQLRSDAHPFVLTQRPDASIMLDLISGYGATGRHDWEKALDPSAAKRWDLIQGFVAYVLPAKQP